MPENDLDADAEACPYGRDWCVEGERCRLCDDAPADDDNDRDYDARVDAALGPNRWVE